MTVHRMKSIGQGQRGLAMVELVIVMPLLLLLIFATAEFGRAFMQYNTLTKSVRDSVRHVASRATLGQTGVVQIDSALTTEAQNLVVYGSITAVGNTPLLPGLNPANISVTPAGAGDVLVSATYTYQPINAMLPGFGIGPNRSSLFTFQAAATMRAL
jgi:Flp pilus assembly protein TadG